MANEYKLSYTAQEIDEKLQILPQTTSTTSLPTKEYIFTQQEITDDYALYRSSFIFDEDKYLPLGAMFDYKFVIDKTEYTDFVFSKFGTYTEGFGFGNEYLWSLWVNNHDSSYWRTETPDDTGEDICIFYNCGDYYDGDIRPGQLMLLVRNLSKYPKIINVSIDCSIKQPNSIQFTYRPDFIYSGDEAYNGFTAPEETLKALPNNISISFTADGTTYTGLWHIYDFGYGLNGWLGNIELASKEYFDGSIVPSHALSDEDFVILFGYQGRGNETYITLDYIILPNNKKITENSAVSLVVNNFSTVTQIKSKYIESNPNITMSPSEFTLGLNTSAPASDGEVGMAIGNESLVFGGMAIGNQVYAEDSLVIGGNVGGIDNSLVIGSGGTDSQYDYYIDKDLGLLHLKVDYYPNLEGIWGLNLIFSKNNFDPEGFADYYEENYESWAFRYLISNGSLCLTFPLAGRTLSSDLIFDLSDLDYDQEGFYALLKASGVCKGNAILANNGILIGDGYAENGLAIEGTAVGYGGSYNDGRNAVAIFGSASGCNNYGSYAIAINGDAEGDKAIALGGDAIGDGNIAIGGSLTTGNDSILLTNHAAENESSLPYHIQDLKLNHKYLPVQLTQEPKNVSTYDKRLYYCYISGGWNIYVYSGNDRSHQIDEVFYETAPEGFPGSYTYIWMYFYQDSNGQYYGQIVTPKVDTVEVTTSSSEQVSRLSVGTYYTLSSEGLVQVIRKLDDYTIVLQPVELGTRYFYNSYQYNFYIPTNTASYTRNFGYGTSTNSDYQTVMGKYNEADDKALFVIGNGEGHTSRSNALAVDKQGNTSISGNVTAKSFSCRQINKNYLSIQDYDNEDEYAIWVRNGEFLFTLIPKTIEINTYPNKMEYCEGDRLDFTGLTFKAIYNNGDTNIIEEFKLISHPYLLSKQDNLVKFQIDTPFSFELEMEVTINDFDESILQDFTYTKDSEGYYLIESWKQTLNGEPSSTMMLPDNALIKI